MVTRTRAWLVVAPVLAAGVLGTHTLAYRLTGTPTDAFHAYLAHVPQILLLVALAGLVLGGLGERLDAPRPVFFAAVAVSAFVAQEHLERIVHGGGVPMLLTTPAFLVGVLLQIPAALVAWGVARWLLSAVGEISLRRPTRPRLTLELVPLAVGVLSPRGELRLSRGRAPPALLSTS
jgi:hypothetical protein